MNRNRAEMPQATVSVSNVLVVWFMMAVSLFVQSHRRQIVQILAKYRQMAFNLYLASALLSTLVVVDAYYQKKQFYPTVVYLVHSPVAIVLYHVQCVMCIIWLALLVCKLFLGTLRHTEFDNLVLRLCHTMTETSLIFAFFPDAVKSASLVFITLLICLKSFHWLVQKRVDILRRTVFLRWLPHLRVALLWFLLLGVDCTLIIYAFGQKVAPGNQIRLVICFECTILLTIVLCTATKHLLQVVEERFGWEWHHKTLFLLCADLVTIFIKLLLYLMFFFVMASRRTLPMFTFHPMFFAIRDFVVGLYNLWCSFRAIRILNNAYPEATPSELRDSDVCVICRENMTINAKKLPCGHIFHTNCLYAWYLRQRSCPVCRFNVLNTNVATNVRTPAERSHSAARRRNNAPTLAAQDTTVNSSPEVTTADNNVNVRTDSHAESQFEQSMPNLYHLPSISSLGISANLADFSEKELNAMEATMCGLVEERLIVLRQIKELCNAADGLMKVYQSAVLRTQLAAGTNERNLATSKSNSAASTPIGAEQNDGDSVQ